LRWLILIVIGVLVAGPASAQTPQPSGAACGPVKIGGQTHYPGEVWRDNQGEPHYVPDCSPSVVTPAAPPPAALPPTAAAPRTPAHALDEIQSARNVCNHFDASGTLTEKCEISGWYHTVDLHMNLTSTNAQVLCASLPEVFNNWGATLNQGWTVRIYSPYSGDHPIATCTHL
jgi:hypothetical protein